MAAPTKLGKYLLESVLGKGAMGVVYQAYDPEIRQSVAIKTLHKEQINLEDADCQARLDRLKQELIAGRRLKHPNIVALYEYGRDQETCYIVMELVRGRQLKDYFSEGYPFTLGEIIEIMLQLLDALDYAHRHGVIHRDIKPANIMLTESHQVQITDFGISKIDDSSLTKTGVILGTPNYMAPEQCLGQHVDARADIFAVGVLFYQFLTREKPFVGDSALTIMHRVLNATPINPSELNLHLPKVMDGIVRKALAKRPDDRFQSAREFADALRAVAGNLKSPRSSPERQSHGVDDDSEGETVALAVGPATSSSPAVTVVPGPYRTWLMPGLAGGLILLALGVGVSQWSSIGAFVRQYFAVVQPVSPNQEKNQGEQPPPVASESWKPIQSSLETLFARFSCAHLETHVDSQNQLILQGHVKPDDRSRLDSGIAGIVGTRPVVSRVETLQWPYCEVTEILAPLKSDEDGQSTDFGSKQHITRYVEGDDLVLKLTAPSYDAYLYVDYYQIDGGVIHLFPYASEQYKRYPARKSFTIGDLQQGGKQWQVQAPFGTELIVILASRDPLFDAPRSEVEPAREYIAALREAIARSNKDGLTVDRFYITTSASN